MKLGWKTTPLESACQVFAEGDWIETKDQSPRGVRLIQTGNGGEGDFKDRDDKARYVSDATFKRLRCTEIFPGDCLISRLPDPVGRSCIVPETGERMITAVDCTIVRFDPERLIPKFFNFYSQSPGYLKAVDSETTGTTRKRISRSRLGQISVPTPRLSEQQRIVDILNKVFECINTIEANTEKNLQNARELFQNAFESLASKYDPIQSTNTTVAEVARTEKGSIRTGPFGSQLLHGEFVEDGIAVLGIDNVVTNEFKWAKRRFITVEKFRELSRYKVKPGDVLITIMGTCGRCAIVPDDVPTAINTKHLCCISLDPKKCIPEYLHAYFLYDSTAREFLTNRAKGSIMAGLNMGIIEELPLRLPPLDQQREIVGRLEVFRSSTRQLEDIYLKKLDALQSLKQSLLHQAFTGAL